MRIWCKEVWMGQLKVRGMWKITGKEMADKDMKILRIQRIQCFAINGEE